MFETPVLFIVFNRLDTARYVFEEIRKIKPKYLFISADGPRAGNIEDVWKCKEVREYVLNNIDWDCKVKTLFHERNLGCGKGPSQAVTWFFDNISEGIILEDDTVPNQSFFFFCRDLLEIYKDDPRIMHIGGNNYFNNSKKYTYYFSRYIHPPHGWATWKRAWSHFDFNLKDLEIFIKKNEINNILKRPNLRKLWLEYYSQTKYGKNDVWDNQWQFSIWQQNGYAIMPYLNLVKNVGYNENATHTKNPSHRSNINVTYQINEMIHPIILNHNPKNDDYKIEYLYLNKPTLRDEISRILPSFIKKLIKLLKN